MKIARLNIAKKKLVYKNVLRQKFERIEGDLIIYYNGRIFIDDTEMKYTDEKLTLTVKQFKQIIKDVVADTKEGLWG